MLLITILTGVVLVGLVAVLNARGWRDYKPGFLPSRASERDQSLVADLADNPTVWIIVFVGAIALFGGTTIMFVSSGGNIPESVTQTAGIVLGAAAGLVAITYLFFGTFMAARGRGVGNAAAAAVASWVLGMLFVVVLVVKLMGMV